MISISTKDAVKKLGSIRSRLTERQFNTAVSRAINESILQGRTEARNSVKSLYNIPQRYIGGINVFKANSFSLIGKIYASSKPIPMDAFSPKFETGTRTLSISKRGEQRERTRKRAKNNPGKGVSVAVLKGKREVVPYAFLIPGAKPRVFARGEYRTGSAYGFVTRNKRVKKSGSDTPIKPLISVTVHAAVINRQSIQRIARRVNNVFPASVERNVRVLLNRVGP
ncbi:hypothetical protein [Parasegetibacter sp. NRK P23]|uniref:hypothetical protein n=1 Tax=Parasegetibacter sp. NRK P23 TaxID=2942999 RepID=UPI00204369F2|nr:hypothetical protein [Parasegetibacter sp. NRK P23]MCM5528955.1 hypothetical protein [Parasegetibacter sp. NRK P23]